MPLKCGSSVRFPALILLVFIFFNFTISAQDRERKNEDHSPRLRATHETGSKEDREERDRENPREREAWFMKGRLYKGHAAPRLLMRAQQQRDRLRRQSARAREVRNADRAVGLAKTDTTPQVWTELGPSPLRSVTTTGDDQDYGWATGRTTAVAVDQSDPTGNTVYIGGAYGGVWKSTNAANPDVNKVRWRPITDDQATLAVGAIAIHPAESNILLVGTGEANSSGDSYYGLGILRSTDAGNSWTLISEANNGLRRFHGLAFSKFAFNTDNPSIVVAATAAASEGITVGAEDPANDAMACANLSAVATCRGLYYSYDSGQTWSQVVMLDPNGAPDNGSVSDVVYNPQQQRFYAWSRGHGLYTSTDGTTFTRAADEGTGSKGVIQPASAINLANCPSSPVSLQTCPMYRGQIALALGRDEMYVWFVDSSSPPVNGGIYQTKDGGKSWVQLNTSGIDSCGDSMGCGTEQGHYNLVLDAVPNGSATDLYAGAINIYRCQITSNNSTCSAAPFINLTHVYGCAPTGSFSKVHPDQHAFDFLASNANIIYFGNDGGIYRTIASLNGAMVPPSCQDTNHPFYPFENLNGTMGSMTQFVWFQQHPTNQFTLLGGTQDNGSPAIDGVNSGSNGLTWRSVLGGDGGYTEINPSNANEWFTANTRVSIQRCAAGTNCTDSQFATVISSETVGADDAAFYMPYMLDPQNPTQIILGTCRVWRVPSNGKNAPSNALSQAFDGSVTCSESSPSLVSALAAGGPQNAQGSSVIYAGTADGQIYVTTNATEAQTNWMRASDSVGFANWNNYPISGLAIDPAVPAGTTAYATVMGFQTGHVFQTTDGGASWTDITGNLPDSPADGIVIDDSTKTVYVATDVGVFSTSLVNGSSTEWTEVGPATGPGTLPNVAVTRAAIFHPQGQPPRLRVSTYGRGIWEMPLPGSTAPDYAIAVTNPELVTSPSSSVTYNGFETLFNNYNGTVTVSCAAGPSGSIPALCSASAISGGAFTVTAMDSSVQDFSFRIQGSDGTLVRQVPVTLRIVDFTLGTAVPNAITDLVHGNTATVQLPLRALGSFDQPVTVNCDSNTLPSGMTCLISPAIVTPGEATQVTVRFETTANTAVGSYTPQIRATADLDAQHTISHTQTVAVEVTAKAGYALDASGYAAQTLGVGEPLVTSFTITPHDGYTGTVLMTCSAPGSGIPPSACTLSLTPGGKPVSSVGLNNTNPVSIYVKLDTTAGTAGARQLDITVTDADHGMSSHVTFPFALTDFAFSGGGQTVNVSPGTMAKFTFSLTPVNGYKQTVNLSCDTSALGTAIPCTFGPTASVTLVPGQTTVVSASFAVPNSTTAGLYPVTVTATDATLGTLYHAQSSSLQVQVNPEFSFSFGSSTVSAKAGSTIAAIPITVSASGGFNATINWGVAGCPQLATCTVSPSSSLPGEETQLLITTTAPSVTSYRSGHSRVLAWWMGMPFGVAALLLLRNRKAASLALMVVVVGLAGCGGGGGGGSGGTSPPITHPGTPAGTYTIVVTGTAGTTVHAQNFTLTVQ